MKDNTWIALVILFILISIICGIVTAVIKEQKNELEKQAIKRGYAKWNINKEFEWIKE